MASLRTIASRFSQPSHQSLAVFFLRPRPSLHFTVTGGVDGHNVADATAQRNRFLANAVEPRRRVLEPGFSFSSPAADAGVFC